MKLNEGLEYYAQSSDSDWQFTLKVESDAAHVLGLIASLGDDPNDAALGAARRLLIDIEKWKAMCLHERMGNAEKNSPRDVWNAFRSAVTAGTDRDAILSIMQLRGFGLSRDEESGQRRAKVATAALRFLKPDSWGVVDWRTVAILGCLDRSNWDVDQALHLAKKENANELRTVLDIIDEDGACDVNQRYRALRSPTSFPRTVDAEMALFGLSLMAWPLPKSTSAK